MHIAKCWGLCLLEEILGNRDHKQHLWDIVEAIREGEKKKEKSGRNLQEKNVEQGDEEEDRRIINQRSLATCFSDHFLFFISLSLI